jgi:hypothetical protein
MDKSLPGENNQQDKPYKNQINDFKNNKPEGLLEFKPASTNTNSSTLQPQLVPRSNLSNPKLMVLQWLTYAFWAGTVVALSVLSSQILTFYLIKDTNLGDTVLYSLAAILVLLPISIVCDILYIKKEPECKTGLASIIMIIHAVIFALAVIGSLITVIFSITTLIVNGSGSETTMTLMYSALIVTLLFAILFLRTFLPSRLYKMRKKFVILMALISAVICIFGVVGPVADAKLSSNDRLIENNLSFVVDAISSYTSENNKLPNDLKSIKLTGDAKKIVNDNLATYTKNTDPGLIDYESDYILPNNYYYQLCVTYKKASTYTSDYVESSIGTTDDYSTYASTYSHPAGKTCYKLVTSTYGDSTSKDTPELAPVIVK